ncbi:hypothetical protein HKW74_05190 [Pseudomonas aeruginosa]|nr:hypothetical protein [Pseudomonas aeruginosa]MBF3040121.1 hypothetical protein [Pseudomonas aeruginosa]MBF3125333.1 hypothetical protein [Pseudomonas aeruginosa]MBF3218846.1 hypothetical protein [Pseudomonas aeruginosa]MBF3227312.1 hypothetical protein [Pseudomonas aeruginosa]
MPRAAFWILLSGALILALSLGVRHGFGLFLGGFVEGLLQALALVLVRLALQQEALCLGEGQQTGVAEVFGRAMRMAAQQRQGQGPGAEIHQAAGESEEQGGEARELVGAGHAKGVWQMV